MGQHGEEERWADCQNRRGRYVRRGGAAPRRAAGRRRARAAWRPGGSGHAGPILSSLPVPGRAGGQRRHLWALGLSARRRGGVLVAWLAAHSDHSAPQMHSVRAAAQRNVCKLNETNLQQQTCLLQHTHTRGRARLGGPPVCPTFSSRRLATIVDRTWRRRLRRPSKRERAHDIVSRDIASEVRRVGAGGGARRWAKWARGRSIRDGCQPRQLWRAIRARRARETLIDTPRYYCSILVIYCKKCRARQRELYTK